MNKEEILRLANEMELMGYKKVAHTIHTQAQEIIYLEAALNRAIAYIESLNKSIKIDRKTI
jgi:hypothetical protein